MISYIGIEFRACQAYLIWMTSLQTEPKKKWTRTQPYYLRQSLERRIKIPIIKRANPKFTSRITEAYFCCRSSAFNSIQQRCFSPPTSGSQRCEVCEKYDTSVSYCNVCDFLFCGGCWNSQPTHKRNRLAPGDVPHERTDHNMAKTIQTVLQAKTTDEEQAVLHQNDQDTTWFGIIREDRELPIFRDYGRYATLMTSTPRFAGIVNGSDTRYPSLVSFVGDTGKTPFKNAYQALLTYFLGAGKSTIIKLVIDLCSRKDENYATPVVGPVGKDVPTSGDVHLYSDPQTATSDSPILYADCEGLQGGEREPLGAWRKAKHSSNGSASFERKVENINNGSERIIIWATSNVKKSREYAVTQLYPRLLYTFSDVIVFVLKNIR